MQILTFVINKVFTGILNEYKLSSYLTYLGVKVTYQNGTVLVSLYDNSIYVMSLPPFK